MTSMPLSTDARQMLQLYRQLCPTIDYDVPLAVFRARLGWDEARAQAAAWELVEADLIDVDAGMGDTITVLEGR